MASSRPGGRPSKPARCKPVVELVGFIKNKCPPWDSVNFVLLKKLAQQYRYCPYSLQAYHMLSKRPKNGEPL